MKSTGSRTAVLTGIWILGVLSLAVPGVQACLTGAAGLAVVGLPLAVSAIVLAGMTALETTPTRRTHHATTVGEPVGVN